MSKKDSKMATSQEQTTSEEMLALKNLRKSKRISFTNRLKHLKETLEKPSSTKDDIKVALNLMTNSWVAETLLQEQITEKLASSNPRELDAEVEQYEEREREYVKAKVMAEKAINDNDTSASAAGGQVTELATALWLQNQYESKIKPFHGTYKEWPSWIGSFLETVDSQPLSDTDKNNILRNCLKGPAKDVAAAFQDLGSTYKTLLEALKKKYDKPLDIMSDLVEELVEFPPCSKDVAKNLKKLTNTLKNCLSVFEIYGCEASKHPEVIVPIVRSKFPSKIRGAWSKATREYRLEDQKDLMEKFIDFLDEQCTIEAAQAAAYKGKGQPKREGPVKKKYKAFVTQANQGKVTSEKKRVTCMLCEEEHMAKDCNKTMSPKERYDIVVKKKGCTRCLTPFHSAGSCKSPNICKVNGCERPHHPMLHFARD